MSSDLTEKEMALIRQGIKEKYVRVAQTGSGGCFQYPTGAEGMRLQGYPLDLVKDFPKTILDSFCGVGNPFSLGPIREGEVVLDIGCGAGVDTLMAARMVGPKGRVVGLDVTEEMIQRAGANLSLVPSLNNVSFQVGETESLPFPDKEFDVIISNGVFNLTLNKAKALKETYRVLKPGGRLLLADMVLVAELPQERAGNVENWYQ
ncbi:MAG: methyltransferase domain-containing protein [Desulfobaccales bacterium]|nr:methyltransferase domain-containing protein [Desulfobaccales bacterium]